MIGKLENIVREWSVRVLSRDLGDDDSGSSGDGNNKTKHDMVWFERVSLFVQAFATSVAAKNNNGRANPDQHTNDSSLLRKAMSCIADVLDDIGKGKQRQVGSCAMRCTHHDG